MQYIKYISVLLTGYPVPPLEFSVYFSFSHRLLTSTHQHTMMKKKMAKLMANKGKEEEDVFAAASAVDAALGRRGMAGRGRRRALGVVVHTGICFPRYDGCTPGGRTRLWPVLEAQNAESDGSAAKWIKK